MFCKKLLFLLGFLFVLLFSPKTYAQQNFHTTYNVTYNVTNTSTTHVTVQISITNNSTQYFVSSYKVGLGYSDIKNLSVMEANKPIESKVVPTDSGSQIDIAFSNKIVGLGKTRNFSVSFDTSQVSQNLGTAWEVNIPGAQKYSSIDDYNVTVNFPQNMGKISYIKPLLRDINFNGKTLVLKNNEIKDSGLSIAFGDFQVYDVSLKYHLNNGNFFPVTSTIALPPNTSYQEVLINNISPKPSNVEKDRDGNWIATYLIPPAKNFDVLVNAKVRVFLNPKKEHLSQDDSANYLKPEEFWETNDPKIQQTAKNLKSPREIYDYVVSNLTYDFSRVKNNQDRLGAAKVISDPSSATCWEFTDLFIALSRAAGIPAREVNGFAYTTNAKERPLSLFEDILHAWPQYYDENLGEWIDVDPTWGNTTSGIDYFNTMDFDHIAFVIQGSSSISPLPPGGRGDIQVKPSRDFNAKLSSISIENEFKPSYISGFPMVGKIKVDNLGNSITPQASLIVANELVDSPQNMRISEIPPYGHQEVEVQLGTVGFLTKYEGQTKIQLGNTIFRENFKASPIFKNIYFYIGGAVIGIFIIAIFIGFRWTRRISS